MSTEWSREPQQARPVVDIEELHTVRGRSKIRMQLRESPEASSGRKGKDELVRELLNNAGEANVVALCTCQQSKDYPYCDNTHKQFNKETNSNMSPLYVAFVEGRRCGECGDKNGLSCINPSSERPDSSSTSNYLLRPDCTNTNNPLLDTPPTTTTTIKSSRRLQRSTDKPASSSSSLPLSPNSPSPTATPSTSTTTTTSTTTAPSSPQTHTSTTPRTPDTPSVILAKEGTPSNTTTENGDDANNTTRETHTYIPSSIKDPRNKENVISKAEVAMHNRQDDLWMIIKGNVYDITKYVKYHPGGVRALVKFAGKDGTENVQYHSPKMLEILNSEYYIGKLPREEGGGGGGCTIC